MRFFGKLIAIGLISCPVFALESDPAPIPEEVIEMVVNRPLAAAQSSLPQALDDHLQATDEILGRYSKSSTPTFATEKSMIGSKNAELAALRAEARKQLAASRAELVRLGLTNNVKSLDALAAKIEQRFQLATDLNQAIVNAPDNSRRKSALAQARAQIRAMRAAAAGEQASYAPVPTFRYDTPMKSKPQTPATDLPEYVSTQTPGSNMLAFNGDLMLLAGVPPVTPAEATQCSYVAADLDKSATAQAEVRVTPEITAVADSLDYSPVKIYKWVYDNIEFEPYYGSLKGAQATLLARAGNDTDTASLLISLLRASNIPARYVKGQIVVADATPAGANGRAPKWLGVKSYAAATVLLAQGRFPSYGLYNNASGQAIGIHTTHVWVEACVPYGHFRGAKIDNTGHRWIPLDASFKDKTYQNGIATNVTFNYTTFLASRKNGPDSLPHEAYAQQVRTAVRATNSNATLEDVPYRGRINPLRVDILPAGLPYDVNQFLAWTGTTSAEAAALPDAHRYKLRLNVNNSAGTALMATTTLQLPEHVLKRITLSPAGMTAADQTALDAWRNDGNIASAIPTTINVKPVIKSDGVNVTVGTAAVNLTTKNNQLRMQILLPELATGDCTTATPSVACVNGVLYTNIGLANYHALQGYAFQASAAHLATRAARLLNTVKTTSTPNSNLEETEGEFLNIVLLKYMRHITASGKTIGQLDGGTGESGNHIGLTSSQMKVNYLFDLPFAVNRTGFLVDVPGGLSRNVDASTGVLVYKTFLLSGYSSSAFESYIWQENSRLDAVSTVRGIQYARENSIEVLTLTSANWSVAGDTTCANTGSQCYKFTHNTNAALNYTVAEVNSVKANYIDKGFTVTIPRSLIQYGTTAPIWKGSVYVAEKNALPTSASASFIIAGTYAGGYTTSVPITYTYVPPPPAAPTYSTGIQLGPTTPLTVNPIGLPPITLGGSLGSGFNIFNTMSGDPVNMVTGNMYHTEKDISIASRGGLPIVFERAYNSRAANRDTVGTPIGYGWTHSFNHMLKFYGVEGTAAKVSWVDGTGNEKFFSTTSHTTGNITVNTALTNPAGIFVTFRRETNGQYTIREKNGMTYTFETINAGATNTGLKAKLLTIKDRNLNTLTLTYTGNNLSTVKDGLNRGLIFTYNAANRITQIQETGLPATWTPRTWQYTYDASNNLASFKNPMSVANPTAQPPVTYTYYGTADGTAVNRSMKSYVLPNGNSMIFEYYANGRTFRHTNTAGEAMTFSYNDFRRETVQINERGLERRFFFNEWGNPLKIVEENGAEHSYTYDATKPYNRLSKTDPLGYVTSYAYDTLGNVITITSPRSATKTFSNFDAFNQPQRIKDDRGNYSVRKYDAKGNLTESLALKTGVVPTIPYTPVATQVAAWVINTYDTYGNLLTSKRVRDAATLAGPITTTTYDASSLFPTQISRQGDKNGDGVLDAADVKTLVYDEVGRVRTGIDDDWHTMTFTYDAVDRVVTGTDPLGKVRTYTYDRNGNLTEDKLTVSAVQIDRTVYGYDVSDRRTSERRYGKGTLGAVSTTVYDKRGNPTKITDPDGFSLSFIYDEGDRPLRAYDQEGNQVYTVRDVDGRNQCSVDPNGNVTYYTYWDATRNSLLKRQTVPTTGTCPGTAPASGVRAVEYDYDANGNVISTTQIASDGSAARVSFTRYDELNRPLQSEGPTYTDATLGSIRPITVTAYNVLGNPTLVQAGHCTSAATGCAAAAVLSTQSTLIYDDFGRKYRETDPLGKFWTYGYDINNNVTQVTDGKGQITTYGWGFGHQLLSRTNLAGGNVSITRNNLGQPISAKSYAAGSTTTVLVDYTHTYDDLNRPDVITDSRGAVSLNYDYSPAGRLNKVADSHGNATNYLYDAVGRLNGIWAPNYGTVSFRMDPGGRRVEKWLPNGVNTQYAYNADGSLSQVVNRSNTSTIISQHDYLYDGFGNRRQGIDRIGAVTQTNTYTYDALDRLLTAKNGTATLDEAYQYSPVNNLTQQTVGTPVTATTAFVHDAANQLLEARSGTPTGALLAANVLDANGSLSKRCVGGTVTRTATDCTGTTITSLTLDSLNRTTQVAKTGVATETYAYDAEGRRIRKVAGTVTSNYLYQGVDIYAEYGTAYTAPTAVYTHGPGMDDPLMRLTGTIGPNAIASYYHQDGLGSVVGLSNATGGIVASRRYDAWGNTTATTGTLPQYGYTGREPDATGLVYYRARYYDPTQRRFTQRDPIGMPEGVNRYAYVRNNPIMYVDPTGQVAETPWDVLNLGLGGISLVNNVREGNWGWAAVDTVGLIYDGVATAVPFLPAGASAALSAYRAGNTVVNSAQIGMDVARVANVSHEAARAANTATNAASEGRAIHTQVSNAINSGSPSLSGSAVNHFWGANGATGPMPDLSWGQSAGVWADLTTPRQWANHVADYNGTFGTGIPLLYERGTGLVQTTRLPTFMGSTTTGAQLLFGGSGAQNMGTFTAGPSGGLNGFGSIFK